MLSIAWEPEQKSRQKLLLTSALLLDNADVFRLCCMSALLFKWWEKARGVVLRQQGGNRRQLQKLWEKSSLKIPCTNYSDWFLKIIPGYKPSNKINRYQHRMTDWEWDRNPHWNIFGCVNINLDRRADCMWTSVQHGNWYSHKPEICLDFHPSFLW